MKDIDAWSHDAYHAIKKGAAKIKKISYDAKLGAFQLVGDFEGWANQTVSVVVKGIEDAAHVVHAIFNKLEAAIEDAIHWLKAEVIGTLVDSFKLAAQYEKWIVGDPVGQGGLLPYLIGQIGAIETGVDTWLDSQEEKIKHDFDAWRRAVDPKSSMHSMASTAVLPSVAGSRSRVGAGSGDEEYPAKHHGAWLFNFSRWKISLETGIKTDAIQWHLVQDLNNAITTAMKDAAADILKSVRAFAEFWMTAVTHPRDILGLLEKDLLDAVEGIVEFAFYLVRTIADAFFTAAESVLKAFGDMLFKTDLLPLPGLQQLLSLANIQVPSLGRFLLAVLAFPSVVTHKIKHHGDGYPFQTTQLAGRRKGATNEIEEDILAASAGISFLSSAAEGLGSLYTASREKEATWITGLEIAFPIMLTILDTPNTEGKKPFTPPPWNDDTCFGYVAWALGVGDAVIAALELTAHHQSKGNKAELDETTDSLLKAKFALGAWMLIFSCLQAHADHDDGYEYADAVLDSLHMLASPLLTDDILDMTTFVSAGVDAAITFGAAIASAILYAREANA